jgi:hypothetical protein
LPDIIPMACNLDLDLDNLKNCETNNLTEVPVTNIDICELNTSVAKLPQKEGKRNLWKEVETLALDYITQEVHHPVISCFRELTRADLNVIFGSVSTAILLSHKSCHNHS